jgi:hypothetical protein
MGIGGRGRDKSDTGLDATDGMTSVLDVADFSVSAAGAKSA